MMMTAHRLRSIGWIALLALCGALVMALSFRVTALRSQVHRAEARIIALRQEKSYLETEFETRANQQQLKAWNDVEFGYAAPVAGQYLENERQLAALSKPVEPDAPAPIRVASVDDSVIAAAAFPSMVSPLTGKTVAHETAGDGAMPRITRLDHEIAKASLGEKLSRVESDTVGKSKSKSKAKAESKGEHDGKAVAKLAAASTKAVAKPVKAASAKPAVKLASAVEKTAKTSHDKKAVEKPAAKPSRLAVADSKAVPGKKGVKSER